MYFWVASKCCKGLLGKTEHGAKNLYTVVLQGDTGARDGRGNTRLNCRSGVTKLTTLTFLGSPHQQRLFTAEILPMMS